MNIRILAASLFSLAVLAPAANANVLHRHHHHENWGHRYDHGFYLGFQPEACTTVNGYNVTSRWALDCPASDMSYYDPYAPDGFGTDSFGPTWEGHWKHRFHRS